MLNKKEQEQLLRLAKETILCQLNKQSLPVLTGYADSLQAVCGVFVTLKRQGQLRGCIGNIIGVYPLMEGVQKMALAAAFNDPRFPPLTLEEFDDLDVEISVLTMPQPIKSIDEIEVGRHGLIIRKGFYQGVLLPQVPVELNWNLDQYLAGISQKAGLPPDGWKEAELETFEAQVFS